MARTEVRISGFGGQGVILTGIILGKSAALFEGKNATMTQAFGPEARGSACSSQVIVDDDRVLFPYVSRPDLLVTMSQEAWTKFSPGVKPGGKICVEEDLVKMDPPRDDCEIYKVPAIRFAEELGRKIVLNIVMFGFFIACTGIVSHDAALDAVLDTVPPRTKNLNKAAFEKGYEHGETQIA